MNTKSFVNGFDPEKTVKGYYDENDQMVMVEPEGYGRCELRTVTMTVSEGINLPATTPKIGKVADGVTDLIVCMQQNIRPGTYKLAATESGGAFLFNYDDVVVSGDAEIDNGVLIYTGDFTISPAESGGE